MTRSHPPKEDWLPNDPAQLDKFIAYLEAQRSNQKAHRDAAYEEHLEAARAKLKRIK